jgi:uncharacterized protein (DUF486 family)
MRTILLLIVSNTFMTLAWYGHLKHKSAPLFLTILASWGIAFFEYCFQVPANRFGYGQFTGYQLKIIQEVITLVVFVVFAWFYLDERLRWNHFFALLFLCAAVASAFWQSPMNNRQQPQPSAGIHKPG